MPDRLRVNGREARSGSSFQSVVNTVSRLKPARMPAAVVPNRVVILDKRKTAAAGAELHAYALPLFDGKIFWSDTSIRKRFARRRQRQRHCARNVLAIFRAELSRPIKVAHLRRDLYRRFRNIE